MILLTIQLECFLALQVLKHMAFGSRTLAERASSNQDENNVYGSLEESNFSSKPIAEYSLRKSDTVLAPAVESRLCCGCAILLTTGFNAAILME